MNTKYWSPCALPLLRYKGYFPLVTKGFCLFILFMGFSRQECWSGLPFLSPVDLILSELSTMTHPSWVALHGMAHSFTELDNTVVHVIKLVIFLWLWFQSVCPLMPSLSAYCLTWVSLTLDVGYLFMVTPAKRSWGSWPWTWGSCSPPLRRPAAAPALPSWRPCTAGCKKCKKAKWLSEEALQIAVRRREVKSKGEEERYTHLNAEFQRIARRDNKAFLSDQCKEIEENNRMGKTRSLKEN